MSSLIYGILRDLFSRLGLNITTSAESMGELMVAWNSKASLRVWVDDEMVVHLISERAQCRASLSDPDCFKVIEEFVNYHVNLMMW